MIKAKIIVKLKNTILDPQGKTIQHALETLGYKEIENFGAGKLKFYNFVIFSTVN